WRRGALPKLIQMTSRLRRTETLQEQRPRSGFLPSYPEHLSSGARRVALVAEIRAADASRVVVAIGKRCRDRIVDAVEPNETHLLTRSFRYILEVFFVPQGQHNRLDTRSGGGQNLFLYAA